MMEWLVKNALIMGAREFQRKSGEPVFQVTLGYTGGKVEVEVDPVRGAEFEARRGQVCSCGGPLAVDVRQFGKNVETRVSYAFGHVQFAK